MVGLPRRRTTRFLPLSTFPHDDQQQLCGGEAQMAIPPDTGTVPVIITIIIIIITTNTRLWAAPPNHTR
jgi:hypothetical protein